MIGIIFVRLNPPVIETVGRQQELGLYTSDICTIGN